MADSSPEDQSVGFRWSLILLSTALFLAVLYAPLGSELSIEGQRLAATIVLMALLWCTQAVPLAVTSMIPLVAFPFLGVQPANTVSKSYMNSTILLYFSGFTIAIGVEKWGLHRRLALAVLSVLGTGPKMVVLGFMLGTGLMSMWISNTAATLLMLPIALAVLGSLQVDEENADRRRRLEHRFAVALLLGIAYSASIGGMCTLIGTPTNGVYAGYWTASGATAEEVATYSVSLGQWVIMFTPISVLMMIVVWLAVCLPIWRGVSFGREAQQQIRSQYASLGKMSSGEFRMLLVFLATATLWISRVSLDIGGVRLIGWEEGLSHLLSNVEPGLDYSKLLHDSTAGLLMMFVMFLIPVRDPETGRNEFLMNWQVVESRIPWGILLLFGGGFAIADACSSTGLSAWLGQRLAAQMEFLGTFGQIASVTSLVIFLTEFTSNTATISTLLPILDATARSLSLDPRLLMLPATIAASCAFMLPIATPPNAIVFSSNRLTVGDMMKVGLLLNLSGILIVSVVTLVWVMRIGQVT